MYSTSGNQILFNEKELVHVRGVSRPGLEYLYVDLPAMIPETIQSDLEKIKAWGFNCVRLPLRDKHWFENQQYREMVSFWVQKIKEHDMIALLDLHTQGDSPTLEPFLIRRGEKDALQFWKEIVQVFGSHSDVWFELFNEPHNISPSIWWMGNQDYYGYREILQVIRNHSENICLIGGLDWAYEWAFLPHQPFYPEVLTQKNLVLATHPYGYRGKPKAPDLTFSEPIPIRTIFPSYEDSFSGDCSQGLTQPLVPYSDYGWNESFGFFHVSQLFPVVATEFGLDRPETALQGGWFNKHLIRYFREIEMGYVAWAWVQDRLDYPSLINKDFQPTGRATMDSKGPACSARQNWFYEGPGKLVWQDLQTVHHRRKLVFQEETRPEMHWSYFLMFPLLIFLGKRGCFSKNNRNRYSKNNDETTTQEDSLGIKVLSDCNLRNRSSTCLNNHAF